VFFAADGHLTLVDMPGYGYAAAPKPKVAAWTALIQAYLRGRANLSRVYVLVDARRGLTAADNELLETLDTAAVSYQIVFTKADAVKTSDLAACQEATAVALARHPAAFPGTLATSARSGAGIPELRAVIARLLVRQRT
jgi:GTP-binding protein